MTKNLQVACPICKKKFNYYESASRPFCSDRCKMVDLGKWLNEEYNVPVVSHSEEMEESLEELLQNEDEQADNKSNSNPEYE
jgi:endogenous inhibitor of DNA gyrase (YacG/DUF329 family)